MKKAVVLEREIIVNGEAINVINTKHTFKSDIPFLVLFIPALVVVFLVSYLPMLGILVGFKDFKATAGIFGSPWAKMGGFANFAKIFQKGDLLGAIWNTFYMNLVSIILNTPAPIILALLLTEVNNKAFKKVTQTISYLPHFLSWAAVTAMVYNILGTYGLMNSILSKFGADPVNPFADKGSFLPIYYALNLWKNVGWSSIIYLATISGINQDLYEAAQIDGANRWQQVGHITVPGIIPTATLLLIMTMGTLFGSNFELVQGLRNVTWDTEVISTWVFNHGVGGGNYGIASALSTLQGVVAVALTFGTNAISKKVGGESMW